MAQPEGKRRWRMCTMDNELFELLIRLMVVAELCANSATLGLPSPFVVRGEAGDIACFWQSSSRNPARNSQSPETVNF